MLSETKVLISGGGIAGLVLAMLLKQKGYAPTVYERNDQPTSLGRGLWYDTSGFHYLYLPTHVMMIQSSLQPNGLRVLALTPGLLDEITRGHIAQTISYSVLPEDERELSRFDVSFMREVSGGFSMEGVRRAHFLDVLSASAMARGVPIVYGHQLVDVEQTADSVTITFANGATAQGSFLVGADGLHSTTRACLFGQEQATYTGLTQVSTQAKLLLAIGC